VVSRREIVSKPVKVSNELYAELRRTAQREGIEIQEALRRRMDAPTTKVAKLSECLVVMSHQGERLLREVYGVPERKIHFIHHGVPDVPFIDPNYYKDQFHVEGRLVLLTFGLLNPNKGIETVLEALPEVVERVPNIAYIVLGATHPAVLVCPRDTPGWTGTAL